METILPVQQKERIVILDAIRGVALCGILILNMPFFSSPEQWFFNLNVNKETWWPNIATWYVVNYIADGSFRALFSMLFGAGAILLITRLEKTTTGLQAADIYYKRLIWLLIFGLINAYVLLWPGDILYCYAVCGLFIFPFRKSSARLLIGLAIFFMAVLMFKGWLGRGERLALRDKGVIAMAIDAKKDSLTKEQKSDLSKWKSQLEKSKVENIQKEAEKEIKEFHKSYTGVWTHLKSLNHDMQSSILYDNNFFDVMIFIFLGMALYKAGILTGEKPWWLYLTFMVVGYSTVIAWGIYIGSLWRAANFDFYEYIKVAPVKISTYQIRRVFFSFGHIGTLMLLWKSGVFNWLIAGISKIGQMAFSNYLMQSIFCTFIFYGYGFGYFGMIERYQQWYFTCSIWVFQLVFSTVWLHFFRFGPLEWLWRSLTYWKRQPFLKNAMLSS